jgi:hypothetical protein
MYNERGENSNKNKDQIGCFALKEPNRAAGITDISLHGALNLAALCDHTKMACTLIFCC